MTTYRLPNAAESRYPLSFCCVVTRGLLKDRVVGASSISLRQKDIHTLHYSFSPFPVRSSRFGLSSQVGLVLPCCFGPPVLVWSSCVGLVLPCWFGPPVLVWSSSVGLVLPYWFGPSVLVWSSHVGLVFPCWFGLPVLVWSSSVSLVLPCWFAPSGLV